MMIREIGENFESKLAFCAACFCVESVHYCRCSGKSSPAPTAFAKAVGTVKSVTGNSIVLTTDSGEVTVTLCRFHSHTSRLPRPDRSEERYSDPSF